MISITKDMDKYYWSITFDKFLESGLVNIDSQSDNSIIESHMVYDLFDDCRAGLLIFCQFLRLDIDKVVYYEGTRQVWWNDENREFTEQEQAINKAEGV